jgi:hypothetical protein
MGLRAGSSTRRESSAVLPSAEPSTSWEVRGLVFSTNAETSGEFDLSEARRSAARDQQSRVRFCRIARWVWLAFSGFVSLAAFSSGLSSWERLAVFSGLFAGIGVPLWVIYTWEAKNLQYDIPDSLQVDGRGFRWTYPGGKVVSYDWSRRPLIEYRVKETAPRDGSLQATSIDMAPPNGTKYRPRPRVTSEAAQVVMNAALGRGYHLDPTPRKVSGGSREVRITLQYHRLVPPKNEAERHGARALLRGW